MSTTENKAAWLTEAKKYPFDVKEAPMPQLREGEVLIKTRAVAINPIDFNIQKMGRLVTEYPWILGSDGAGEVVETAPDVTNVKVGDRVIALADYLEKGRPTNSTFQLYFATKKQLVAKLPEKLNFTEGCVLPLGLSTAAVCLYSDENLALPWPSLNPKPTGQVLLVWGGSSSVGSCAIMLALASGFEVAATSSSHNLDYLKSIGVKYAFDYKEENVEEEIVTTLKGKDYAGAFSALMAKPVIESCANITIKLGGRQFVATTIPPSMPKYEGLPQGVGYGTVFGSVLFDKPYGQHIWGSWMTAALETGQLKCKPEPAVVGRGVDKIQEACDQAQNASGKKYVVKLP